MVKEFYILRSCSEKLHLYTAVITTPIHTVGDSSDLSVAMLGQRSDLELILGQANTRG